MPASMAARVNGSSAIVVKSERHLDTFRAGLKSFVNEARLLARFDHPSLVKVYRFWEENGTAYMVMPYYEGPTLKAALAALGRPPSEAELRAWLQPLLDALAVMHAAQCFHRDIAPDNILLTPRGPLLLDFGAARRVIGDMTHAITVVLKPGYAPIEQYGDVATMTQGAWTDLYALASRRLLRDHRQDADLVGRAADGRPARAARGRPPPAATAPASCARSMPRSRSGPADRPQTEREFRALLDADRPVLPRPNPARPSRPWSTPRGARQCTRSASISEAGAAGLTRADAASTEAPPAAVPARVAAPRAPRTPAPLLIAAALAVAGAVVAAVVFLRADRGAAAPAPTTRLAPRRPSPTTPHRPPSRRASSDAPALPSPTAARPPRVADEAAGPRPGEVDRGAETPAPAATVDVAPTDTPPTYAPPRGTAERRHRASADITDAHVASHIANHIANTQRAAAAPACGPQEASRRRPSRPRRRIRRRRARRTNGARCSDILQKASLEPLTASEAAYLKRECR